MPVSRSVEILAGEAGLDPSHAAAGPIPSNLVATAFPDKAASCSLCGHCADAVGDAIIKGQPIR
jgi:hypothetical protein